MASGPLHLRRALVLTKFSRLEYEKMRNPGLGEEALKKYLKKKGSDYQNLTSHHEIHCKSRDHVIQSLKSNGVDTKLVNLSEYNKELVKWADVVFTTGGDGTYLMAAAKVKDQEKPVIGVNSDASRSVGHLCIPSKYSNSFKPALTKLSTGDFKWKFRQRIRVTIEGEDALDPPLEIHHKLLSEHEFRYLDLDHGMEGSHHNTKDGKVHVQVIPITGLNEVFVGESLSSRVSYLEIQLDDGPFVKVKCSGVTICTGTGSTSWYFNINKLTPCCVTELISIINKETKPQENLNLKKEAIERVTQSFNDSLIFDASVSKMAYTIRDPIVFGTDFRSHPRGFARTIRIKSRMSDACVVIDGGLSYKFNDGAIATFEIHDQDSLKTVQMD